jgi:soluble lytic murein transglycosylase-like protein
MIMDEPYLDIFKDIATEYDLDWRLLLEQAWRESQWNPKAVGSAGEYGLMQIHPATWEEWARELNLSDPFDPESNIRLAGAYWVWLEEQLVDEGYHETYWLLTAYNWGINNLLRLLKAGGDWEAIPLERREYAINIILSAEVRAVKESLEEAD